MSSTEAILERHEVRLASLKERQDRMEGFVVKGLFLMFGNLLAAVGTLAVMLLKKG